jgi:hypothetical protein
VREDKNLSRLIVLQVYRIISFNPHFIALDRLLNRVFHPV